MTLRGGVVTEVDIRVVSAPLERTSVPGVHRRGGRNVIAYRDPSGKQRRRTAATLGEARAMKAELSADMSRGEYRQQSRITFGEYASEWVRTYTGRTSRGIRATTLAEYVRDLEGHVLPVSGIGGLRRSSRATSRSSPPTWPPRGARRPPCATSSPRCVRCSRRRSRTA